MHVTLPFLCKVTIQNEDKKDMLRIIVPFCACNCFEDVVFEVRDVITLIEFDLQI